MVDPLTLGVTTAARWVTPDLNKRFKAFVARDEMAALYKAVLADMKDDEHASRDSVTHLFSLERPQQSLTDYLRSGVLDGPALEHEIVGLFAAHGEDMAAFAARFVEAVRRTAHKAIADERGVSVFTARSTAVEVVLPELRQLAAAQQEVRDAVEDVGARLPVPSTPSRQVGLLLAGQLSNDITEVLKDLHAADPTASDALLGHFASGNDNMAPLVRAPPAWVASGGPDLWMALGRLLTLQACWELAEQAFVHAEGLPGADRSLALVRAHDCARLAGASDRSGEHLRTALAVDPERVFVRLAEIALIENLEQRLVERDGLAPGDDRERVAVLTAQADDHANLGRFDRALELVDELLGLRPDSLAGLDRRAGLRLLSCKRRVADGLGPDSPALRTVVEDSLAARERVSPLGRARERGGLLARAVEASVLAGDLGRALELLRDKPTEQELSEVEVRRDLAEAAVNARVIDDVLGLLGPEELWGPRDRHIAAHALMLEDDDDLRSKGHHVAMQLLAEDPSSQSAAFAVAAAASQDVALEWSELAVELLAATEPAMAAVLRAERLWIEGHHEQAEAVLASHHASLTALRTLTELALRAEAWQRAKVLSERLVKTTGRGDDRVRHARALRGLGDMRALRAELGALAGDREVPAPIRGWACNALTLQLHGSDLAGLTEVSELWMQADPDAPEPVWNLAYAHSRRGREPEALEILERTDVEIDTVEKARMLAGILARVLDPPQAVRRIAELSDRFGRSDEALEALVIFSSLPLQDPSDPELEARIRLTFGDFSERFPDSHALQTIEAEDPETMIETLAAQLREGQELRVTFEGHVADGTAPLATIADAGGRSIVKAIAWNVALPMSYGTGEEMQADLAGAREAIGMGAVWDAVALTVLAGLPAPLREVLIAPLGQSRTAAATTLIASNAAALLDDREEQRSFVLDGGQPRIVEHDPRLLNRERETTLAALALARDRLGVVADYDAADPDPYDEDLREDDGRATARRACLATISAARRSGLPVYSDDRHVRAMARHEGLRAFCTSALAAALADQRIITEEQASQIRAALLDEGALGLRPTPEELVAAARRADWNPAAPWTQLLADRVAWRSWLDRQFKLLDALLRAVDHDQPKALGLWTARALASFRRGLPEGRLPAAAAVLVAMSWVDSSPPHPEDQRRSARIYRAVLAAPRLLVCAHFDELLADSLSWHRAFTRGTPGVDPVAIYRHVLARLPYDALASVLISMAAERATREQPADP